MDLFYILGLLFIARVAYPILKFVWIHFLRPATNLNVYGARSGAWALVTGASDGIGKGFSYALAQRGFNVVLVSRTKSKLDTIATEIEKLYKVNTKVLVEDVNATPKESVGRIFEEVKNLDLTFLVNNVGLIHDLDFLQDIDEKQIDNLITVNCRFPTLLSNKLLPLLVNQKKARRSAVLELSSVVTYAPMPFLSVYKATKAYNRHLAVAVAAEMIGSRSKVDVMSVNPGFVATALSGISRTSLGVITPDRLAKTTLDKVGATIDISPYWFHDLQFTLLGLLPTKIVGRITYGANAASRAKRLKKQAASAEAKKDQ